MRKSIRIPRDQVQEALKNSKLPQDPKQVDHGVLAKFGSEGLVSGAAEAESEVHAAMNPTDSFNVIVSPIRQPVQTLEGLSTPIYYTTDFGTSWKKSSFKGSPRETGTLMVGGGDPVVAFDADGTAYLTFIALYIKGFDFNTVYANVLWASSTDKGKTWQRAINDVIVGDTVIQTDSTSFDAFYDKQWVACDHSQSEYRNSLYVSYTKLRADGTACIGMKRKPGGSPNFGPECVVTDTSFKIVQFSNIGVDGAGNVHLLFFGIKDTLKNGSLYYAKSVNGGASFSLPVPISEVHIPGGLSPDAVNGTVNGILSERIYPCPQLAVDNSDGANQGNLYVTWTADGIDEEGLSGMEVFFSRSVDGGNSWTVPKRVSDDLPENPRDQFYSSITVNDRGVIALSYYDRRFDPLNFLTNYEMTYSFDGGATFTSSFEVSQETSDFRDIGGQNGGFGIGEYTAVLASPYHAVPIWSDGRDNNGDINIYSAFVDITPNPPSGVRLSPIGAGLSLGDPYPNPARSEVTVPIRLADGAPVALAIYDVNGKLLQDLGSRDLESGSSEIVLSVGMLSNGHFTLEATTAEGKAVKEFIVSK